MKKIYILTIGLLSVTGAFAQEFSWATRAGSWAYDYGYGVTSDASGNVYVGGKYEENAEFGSTTVTCQGNHDVFVAKYSPTGAFQWVRTGGGTLGDYAHAIASDAAGNVYAAGEIEGTSIFQTGSGSGTVTVNGNPGTDDAFVAKYDASGNLLWVKNYGGYDRDDARGVAVDALGNIYVIGVFRGTATFGTTTLNAAGGNIDDVFVMKLDANGNVLWAKQIGSSGDDTGRGIAADASGNVYVTGGFIGTATFGPGVTLQPTGPNPTQFRDSYLAKFDTNGNLQWVKQGGDQWDDVSWAVAVDPAGSNVYITGEFNGNANFNGQTVSTISSTGADVFVVKYDAAGTSQWAKRFGGNLLDRGRGISADASNVYFTGQYSGTVTMGTMTRTAADSSDIFVAAFSNAGTGLWVVTPRGPADAYEDLGYEAGNAVSVSTTGKVNVTGCYLGKDTLNFFFLAPWSRTDMFVGQVDAGVPPGSVGINDLAGDNTLGLFPNPSNGMAMLSFEANYSKSYNLVIMNSIGEVVYQENIKNFGGQFNKQLDLSAYGKGMYMVTVNSADFKAVKKLALY
jgi:hypothetical protein